MGLEGERIALPVLTISIAIITQIMVQLCKRERSAKVIDPKEDHFFYGEINEPAQRASNWRVV